MSDDYNTVGLPERVNGRWAGLRGRDNHRSLSVNPAAELLLWGIWVRK